MSKHFLEVETGKVHIFLPFTNIFGIWRISVIILQEGSSQKIPGLKVLKKVASVGHKNHFSAIKRIFKDFDFFLVILKNDLFSSIFFFVKIILGYLVELDSNL